MYAYIYFYHRTLSAPSSPLLTHSGARHDFGSPRYLWRGETKLRGLIRGVLLGRGAAVFARLATCAPSPCASKFSENPRRSLFGGWVLPERNVFGGGIGSKIRARRSTVKYFRFGRTRVCIRQSVCE